MIKKKRYYFYKITWLDITGDSGHADLHTVSGFMPSEMVTHAYLLNKDRKNVRTFASYEVNDELFSCLLYTSDAADEEDSVDLGGRRIIKKKKK